MDLWFFKKMIVVTAAMDSGEAKAEEKRQIMRPLKEFKLEFTIPGLLICQEERMENLDVEVILAIDLQSLLLRRGKQSNLFSHRYPVFIFFFSLKV